MKNRELAEFHCVSVSAVEQWGKQKKHRKTVEAEAGAEPKVAAIVAELQRLAYVYNCQQYRGDNVVGMCYVSVANALVSIALFDMTDPSFDPFKSWVADLEKLSELESLLSNMEELVYGTPQVV